MVRGMFSAAGSCGFARFGAACGFAIGGFAIAPRALATFHLMQIEQVIGGVNGDTTAQAVQLRMRTSFQSFVSEGELRVWDSAGLNPIVVIIPPGDVTNSATGDRILLTTASFNATCTPTCVPDFTMTNAIPASYLAAGRLTWEDHAGTILWSISWGGAAYTGPTTGALTNSPTGQFGPAFGAALPSTSVQSLLFQGSATAAAGANATDYAVTSGAATFTNNARNSFTITATAPCYANCDGSTGSPALTAADFTCFLAKFRSSDSYANCDGSTGSPSLTAADFTCFLAKFRGGC
jgi:hypothetical protein